MTMADRTISQIRGPEYIALAEQRALYREFKTDYPDVKWLDELVERLGRKTYSYFTDADRADLRRAGEILDRLNGKYSSKYRPDQARVPAGSATGGQWTDEGGGGASRTAGRTVGGNRVSKVPAPKKPLARDAGGKKPASKPKRPPHPHADSPYYNRELDIYDPPIEPVGDPISDALLVVGGARALKPAAETLVTGVTNARNAVRLNGYLREARQIPKNVRETGKGAENLTTGQQSSLKRFKGKGKEFKNPEIINYSDGSAIYSSKVPAKNIPKSYALYEKHVGPNGEVIRTNKIAIGPDGELVHVKPK